MAPVTATGVPNPRRPFEEGSEGEGDEEQLKATIRRDVADRLLKRREPSFLHRQPVEENHVQDDPADGKHAGDDAEERRADGKAGRHGEQEDGDRDRRHQGDDGGNMGLHLAGCDHRQKKDDGNGGSDGGQSCAAEGIIDLTPHDDSPDPAGMRRR